MSRKRHGSHGDGLDRRGGSWYFQYRDGEIRIREKSTGERKQADAREFKHDFLEKLRQNMLPTEEAKRTLAQALEQWLGYCEKTKGPQFAGARAHREEAPRRHPRRPSTAEQHLGLRPPARSDEARGNRFCQNGEQ